MIASIQITNTEIFAFVSVLVLSYSAVKFCLQTEKDNTKIRKYEISRVNYCKIINDWNAKLSGYF